MAVTNQKSTQVANADAVPVVRNHAVDVTGKLRVAYFNSAQSGAGDAGSDVELVRLPAGRIRIMHDLCRFANSAFGASRTLNVGMAAYTGIDGEAVAADTSALVSAQSVASAGAFKGSEADDIATATLITSQGGVSVMATVAGGTIPDGATLDGYIVFACE